MSIETIAIVGLGYVGLPLAVAFGKQLRTIGFDLNEFKLNSYREKFPAWKDADRFSILD